MKMHFPGKCRHQATISAHQRVTRWSHVTCKWCLKNRPTIPEASQDPKPFNGCLIIPFEVRKDHKTPSEFWRWENRKREKRAWVGYTGGEWASSGFFCLEIGTPLTKVGHTVPSSVVGGVEAIPILLKRLHNNLQSESIRTDEKDARIKELEGELEDAEVCNKELRETLRDVEESRDSRAEALLARLRELTRTRTPQGNDVRITVPIDGKRSASTELQRGILALVRMIGRESV